MRLFCIRRMLAERKERKKQGRHRILVAEQHLPHLPKRTQVSRFPRRPLLVADPLSQQATTFWFFSGNNVTMNGGGTIDGNGQIWYVRLSRSWHDQPLPSRLALSLTCHNPPRVRTNRWERFATNKDKGVAGGSSRTFSRPIPLVVGNASHITISDIKVVNSPFWNNMVYQSSYVTYEKMFIEAVSYVLILGPTRPSHADLFTSSSPRASSPRPIATPIFFLYSNFIPQV